MEILKFPDPMLFTKSEPVTVFGSELKIILESMYETMLKQNGIGLAANQVGLNMRMFVMVGPMKEKIFLVNPVITSRSQYPSLNQKEGCLSAPGEFLQLKDRAAWVKGEFQDENGNKAKFNFVGVWSVCVQHEIDHLDGISFLESPTLSKATRKELAKKWKLKKGKK